MSHTLGTRTLRGMLWAYGSYVGGRVLVLVATAILARLLDPAEFGLVALALVFTALLESVADLGVGQALVVSRGDAATEARRAETAFAISLALGALLALGAAALAPLAALVFDQPDVAALLAVLGLNFVLRALGSTHYALAQKRMDFRARTVAELADVVVRGLVGIGLALAGAGAWSLVAGYLAGTVSMTIALWLLVPWRPRLRPARRDVRELVGFGGALSAISVIGAVIGNADYAFIGRVLGPAALGLYTLGFRLPELIVLNLAIVAGEVLFPAFASVDRDALGHAFLVSLRYTLMVALPAGAFLVVLAEPLTLAAFGDAWRGSIEPMQLLAGYAVAVAVGIPAGTAYKAVGRADVLLKLAIPRAVLLVTAIAVVVDRGIAAVALCQVAVAALFAAIGLVLAARLLGVGAARIWAASWPAVAATVPAAAAMAALGAAIASPWLAFVAGGAGGAVAYLAVLWVLDRESLVRIRELALPRAAP
jgi:PST family polysaccharide transporter